MAAAGKLDIIESRTDPRDATRITDITIINSTIEDLPPDYYALVSLLFAVLAILFRFKVYSWITCLLSLASLANQRYSTMDAKTVFATVSLILLTFVFTHVTINGRPVMSPVIPGF